ncbi:hypothetical protein [Candidatus Korobacter versatilis]|uniref:hypothetical protein n=1 Tax=Candidatus Korobacter versatilis TaxID=658062 RepID=UPI0002DE111F|nr:hypothetical protein [Candidatus Koribacter versatilis]
MNARRKVALGAAVPFLLVGCVLLVMGAFSKTEFEREHGAALKDNPWGVELTLQIANGQRQFHPGDTLRFREFYTAKSPRMWQLEVLEDGNDADAANLAFISNGSATIRQPYSTVRTASNKWRFVTLDTDPLRVPYFNQNAEWHSITLPREPGRYQIYVQTHRLVLRKGGGLDPSTHIGYPLTSELIDIEIIG